MTIKSIEIKNFKSIENLNLTVNNLHAFMGKNGVGKSTILKATNYFYDNLVDINITNKNFDSENTYKNELNINIKYDLSRIYHLSTGNFRKKLNIMLAKNKKYVQDKTLEVKFSQNKAGEVRWNIDYDERYIIFNTHPIYFCDTRSLKLTDWDSIWNVVGDLVNAKDANDIEKNLFHSLKHDSFKKFNSYSKLFEDFMKSNKLSFNKSNRKDKIISLLQLQLGGKEFINKAEKLEYYSDGTNSNNYLSFLIYIAYEISRRRLKDVTIFLDEPELGLHPSMIDTLMEKIVDYSEYVKFMIFSHSPRLISYILKNNGEISKVYLEKNYTEVIELANSNENKHKLLISENEASYLFADYLLFVEGITEIELFSNKILRNLFPVLKKIDLVNTKSNDHVMRVLLPENNKSKIPYLILVDLDKLVGFNNFVSNQEKMEFYLTNIWYSPFNEKGNFRSKNKYNYAKKEAKQNLKFLNNIEQYKKQSFPINNKWGLVENFDTVYQNIKSICLSYNLYPVRTTIEGVLINRNSLKYIKRWKKHSFKKINNISKENELIIYRLLFDGKTDILTNHSKSTLLNDYKIGNRISKNSNWISEFFQFYYENILSQKQYAKDYNNSEKRKRFAHDFPELYDIIKIIEKSLIVSS